MKNILTKSLGRSTSDKDIEKESQTTSFLSFSRAIEESLAYNRSSRKPIGYSITEQGIILHFKD